ncbi:unnamed protein product [Hyaloperonospora brassicae]|uniref:RxLR effector candidate protein n=1 Tax=Hyaloperonospora brassicae TaxID=162125 RepID=A0AAV0U2B5_HYABA|nr:unnamed protein product [Hyaloperonospora brassicae]
MAGLVPVLRHRAPVLAFSAMCAGAAYAVYYAHHQQITEKKTMRQGVINDIKRDRIKRRHMEQQQQQQRELDAQQ